MMKPMPAQHLQLLRQLPLFEGVSEPVLKMVAETRRTLRFAPGEVLLSQEAPGEALLLLTSGVVKVTRNTLGGRERILGYIYAPAVLGETAVLNASPRNATVTAASPVVAQQIFRDELQKLGERCPRILWNLAGLLAQRVTDLNAELVAAGIGNETNLAYVLLGLYRQREASQITEAQFLPLGTYELSQRLGSSRETVVRLLRRFEAGRLVKQRSGGLELLNIAALQALADDFRLSDTDTELEDV